MDKIICLGKNYLKHAQEMKEDLPEKPVIFIKPPSNYFLLSDYAQLTKVVLDDRHGNIQPELEVVIQVDAKGKILNFTLGLDLTKRELQKKLKAKGHPWTIAKVFEHAAVVAPWIPFKEFEKYEKLPFTFSINGEEKQKGFIGDMLLKLEDCPRYILENFPLHDKDVIFTGTPEGVFDVVKGDTSILKWGNKSWPVEWI
jgi:2-keto-4-pentenoate hydratase/2-oxohepta-3-ene-1,7-dioic acid hydratase in catechol pathway